MNKSKQAKEEFLNNWKNFDEEKKKKLANQYENIRLEGRTNMMDKIAVLAIAIDNNYVELANFMREATTNYPNFMFAYDTTVKPFITK